MKLVLGSVALMAAGAAATVGRVGRDTAPALDRLPGWAGGRPDVAACERYIGKTLAAPSTYRRISVMSVDSGPLEQAAFDREAGISEPVAPRKVAKGDKLGATLAVGDKLNTMRIQIERDRAVGHDLRLRTVKISYDAADLQGSITTSEQTCLFRLIDNSLDSEASIIERSEHSAANITANAVWNYQRYRRAKSPSGSCCL